MEAFRDFVLLKAYDVVSGGQFRKHVSASKERGDAWACAMQAHHNATSDAVKELLASLLSMKDDHFRDLQVLAHALLLSLSFFDPDGPHAPQAVARETLASSHPPVRLLAGKFECAITGAQLMYCLDVSRNTRQPPTTCVHLRFWPFFVLLWYCAKLDYVIRCSALLTFLCAVEPQAPPRAVNECLLEPEPQAAPPAEETIQTLNEFEPPGATRGTGWTSATCTPAPATSRTSASASQRKTRTAWRRCTDCLPWHSV